MISFVPRIFLMNANEQKTGERAMRPRRLALPITLLVVSIAVRSLLAFNLEPVADEAYYWTWSQELRWSYFDHPPLTGWLIWATTWTFGNGGWAIRLGWLVLSLIFTWQLYRLLQQTASQETTLLVCALINATPMLMLGGGLATPDLPLLVCWTGALSALLRIANGERGLGSWLRLGLWCGLGGLAKYSMALFLVPLVVILLSRRAATRALTRPAPWVALAVASALCTPVFMEEIRFGFSSFRFQFGHAFGGPSGVEGLGVFVLGQLALIGPAVLWLPSLWRASYRGRAEASGNLPWLAWCSSLPILLFVGVAALRGGVEPNWALPAYPGVFLGLAWWFDRPGTQKKRRRIACITAVTTCAISLILATHLVHPWLPLPPETDFAARARGQQTQWARIFEEARQAGGNEQEHQHEIELGCVGYQLTATCRYFSARLGEPTVRCLYVDHPRRLSQFDRVEPHSEGLPPLLVDQPSKPGRPLAIDKSGQERCGRIVEIPFLYRGHPIRPMALYRCPRGSA